MLTDDRIRAIAEAVATAPGVRAVVLGGSRARGTHQPGSDVDLGLYYDAARLDVPALAAIASELTGAEVEVAGPGGWGPWVDGGAWLRVDGAAVDLILRDVRRVAAQRDRAIAGRFAFHQQMGHPLGFLDVAYAAEAATCVPLVDPELLLPELRRGLDPYPAALRAALIENLWSAQFLAEGAAKGAAKGDVAFVQMTCSAALMLAAHAWHAAAGSWVTTEKGLVPSVAGLELEAAADAGSGADAGSEVDVGSEADAGSEAGPRPAVIGPAAFAQRAAMALGSIGPGRLEEGPAAVAALVAQTRAALSGGAGAPG